MLIEIDITGFMSQRGREIAGLTVDLNDLGINQNVNIEMPTGFDQLGADGAHSAVVRREGLIELCHVSADGGLGFHEIDAVALVSQVKAGLHSGNTAAYDHYSPNKGIVDWPVCQVEGVCLRAVGHGTPLPWLGAV